MKSPCFNVQTKTDCPKRHVGCTKDCPEWAKYVEERNEEYRVRAITGWAQAVSEDTKRAFRAKNQRDKARGWLKY